MKLNKQFKIQIKSAVDAVIIHSLHSFSWRHSLLCKTERVISESEHMGTKEGVALAGIVQGLDAA